MQSVHLKLYPTLTDIKIYENIVQEMDFVRKICNTVLGIRKEKNIKVRMPLSKLYIINENKLTLNEESLELLKDELNIKEVCFSGNFKVEKEIQLNFQVCGKIFGSNMAKISNAIKQSNYTIKSPDEIECEGFTLYRNENHFSSKLSVKNLDSHLSFSSVDGHTVCVLDCELNSDLENECSARDLIRAIQNARKEMNLAIMDKIIIELESDNNKSEIDNMIYQFKNKIESQTLSKISSLKNCDLKQVIDIHRFSQIILKISKL